MITLHIATSPPLAPREVDLDEDSICMMAEQPMSDSTVGTMILLRCGYNIVVTEPLEEVRSLRRDADSFDRMGL